MTSPRKTLSAGEATKLRRLRTATSRLALPGWRSLQGCGRRLIDRTQGVTVIANRVQQPGTTAINTADIATRDASLGLPSTAWASSRLRRSIWLRYFTPSELRAFPPVGPSPPVTSDVFAPAVGRPVAAGAP